MVTGQWISITLKLYRVSFARPSNAKDLKSCIEDFDCRLRRWGFPQLAGAARDCLSFPLQQSTVPTIMLVKRRRNLAISLPVVPLLFLLLVLLAASASHAQAEIVERAKPPAGYKRRQPGKIAGALDDTEVASQQPTGIERANNGTNATVIAKNLVAQNANHGEQAAALPRDLVSVEVDSPSGTILRNGVSSSVTAGTASQAFVAAEAVALLVGGTAVVAMVITSASKRFSTPPKPGTRINCRPHWQHRLCPDMCVWFSKAEEDPQMLQSLLSADMSADLDYAAI